MDSVRVGTKIITRVLNGGGGAFAERKLNQAPRPARSNDEVGKDNERVLSALW